VTIQEIVAGCESMQINGEDRAAPKTVRVLHELARRLVRLRVLLSQNTLDGLSVVFTNGMVAQIDERCVAEIRSLIHNEIPE